MKLVAANALALVAVLVVINGAITVGSPLPGLGGIPDFPTMGHAFGAKISNIIKGNTYDHYERVMRKLPQHRHKPSSESDASDSGESPMFGFSGKQFEQLLAMLQQSHQGGQPTGLGDPFPLAAIDNGVD